MTYKEKLSSMVLIAISVTPLIITPFPFAFDFFYLPKIMFIYFLLIFMLSKLALHENIKFESLYKVDSSTKFISLYFLLLSLSTLFSIDLELALWGHLLREEGFFALTAYLILFLLSKKYFVLSDIALNWIILSASIISCYGILQHFNLDYIPRDILRSDWSSLTFSTIGNPNFLGSYLVLILPLSIYRYFKSSNLYSIIPIGLLYLCLLMTSTRGAWLGFLASFLFILFITGKMKLFKKELIILISSLIILTLLFNLLESGNILIRFLTIFKEAGAVVAQVPQYSDGGSSRVVIWQHTVELIKVRPWLGYGPDTLGKAISDSYIGVAHDQYYHKVYFDKAHNEYLQIAFASGIPALIVYLIFLLDILLKSAKKIYSDLQIVFILACILGYIVQAFFNVSVVSVAYIYWILLGTLANTAQTK